MSVDPKDIRNVAVVGHNGTGKTSLVESMLYYTGAIAKAEAVAGGKTISDFTEEEIARKISVHTALASTEWMGKRINILDTPGTADFVGEAICSFRTAEAALMLVDARDGAQIETIKLWRRLDTRNKPRAVFINKMDKERANSRDVLDNLTEEFHSNFAPVTIPIGYAEDFKGVIIKFLPILAVVLVLYPIVETFRHSDSLRDAISAADEEEVVGTYTNPTSKNYIVKPFNRRFLTGYLYLVDEGECSNSLFDFSRAGAILAIRGSARYQTFVIDGYPVGVAHSSGTSPFIDGLLIGGYGFMFLTIFIMTFLARIIDRTFRRKTNSLIIPMLVMLYYYWFDGPLYTFLLNEMSIRTLFVYGILIWYVNTKWKRSNLSLY